MRLIIYAFFIILTSCQTQKNPDVGPKAGNDSIVYDDELFNPSTPATLTSVKLKWPINKARLTGTFTPSGPRQHLGIDLAAPIGEKVFSAGRGRVIYSGSEFSGYGKIVIIGHKENSYATFYAHLSKSIVNQGDLVTDNTIIGYVGNTGRTTGPHLHFEVRTKSGAIDPEKILNIN